MFLLAQARPAFFLSGFATRRPIRRLFQQWESMVFERNVLNLSSVFLHGHAINGVLEEVSLNPGSPSMPIICIPRSLITRSGPTPYLPRASAVTLAEMFLSALSQFLLGQQVMISELFLFSHGLSLKKDCLAPPLTFSSCVLSG